MILEQVRRIDLNEIEALSCEGDYAANPVQVALRFMQELIIGIVEREMEDGDQPGEAG